MSVLQEIGNLVKALEAGNYDAAPSSLEQGSALQIEDLSSVMNVVTFETSHLKLQKMITSESCKSTLAQFDRQLSYGMFGGSAQLEGNVGQEETSDFVRITVPMSFYSHIRRVTIASTLVATVDGKKSDERAAADAAMKLGGDIEFDLFRGLDDFSNAGVFDGNPFTIAALPNIHGMGLQVRQSDFQINSRDLMFAEYGSDDSVVLSGGGVALTQDKVEDSAVRSALNFGSADKLMVDPVVLSAYNKITFGKERIILAGSPQDATGGDLRKQWVSGGTVNIEGSMFLRGKMKPARARTNGPVAPTISLANSAAGTSLLAAKYTYIVTTFNEVGESVPTASSQSATLSAGDKVVVTVTHPGSGTARGFNVYRSGAGGTAADCRFIGRVLMRGGGNTTTDFTDLGNKVPGFVTGYLVDKEGWGVRELAPYSRLKLAVTDLSQPEAHFRFLCLAGVHPRRTVLIDNLKGTI